MVSRHFLDYFQDLSGGPICPLILNGRSLSWMGLTWERRCCARLQSTKLDMNTCQMSINTDILL